MAARLRTLSGQLRPRGRSPPTARGAAARASPVRSAALAELPPLAVPGQALRELDTPLLAVDLEAFEANLRALQSFADKRGLVLRPHAKAHKCPEVSLQQIALGAKGICCQKISEAVPFVAAGVKDVLISNQVLSARMLDVLAQLAKKATIAICVDSATGLEAASRAAAAAGVNMDVLVEIDVGASRCGVRTSEEAVELARRATELPGVTLRGLQCYNGAAQHVRERGERLDMVQKVAEKAKACQDAIRTAGMLCDVITGGGTGTADLEAQCGALTELQCGSYAFMDADYSANAWEGCQLTFRHSLFLVASVISSTHPRRAVLDVGLKSTSAECGPPTVHDREGFVCQAVNDEHAICLVEGDSKPVLGEKVKLIPSHVDPTINLHDSLVVLRGDVVVDIWPIEARGLSR